MNHVNMRLRGAKIPYTHSLPDHLVNSLVWNGQQGVQIFFAVSGFLITTTALRRWGQGIDIPAFYRLRFARIAPLLLLLLAILTTLHLAQVKNFVINPKVATLPRALTAALTFHVNVLEATHGYLPANWDILWSLSVEEVFYLVFPLVRRYTKLFIGLLLLCVILGPIRRTHGNEIWREYSYLGGMDAIALGCLTALAVQHNRVIRGDDQDEGTDYLFRPSEPRNTQVTSRRKRRSVPWLTAWLGHSWLCLATGTPLMLFTLCYYREIGPAMTILAIGTCLLIAASAQSDWKAPGILALVLNLGQRSYEIYLTHMFIVFAFFEIFLRTGKQMSYIPILFLTTILASALLGDLVARLYSEPLNDYLRKSSSK